MLYLPHLVQAVDTLILYIYRILFIYRITRRSIICLNVGDQKYGQYNDGAGQPVLYSRTIQNFFSVIRSSPVRPTG
jgi:hypothetical protein